MNTATPRAAPQTRVSPGSTNTTADARHNCGDHGCVYCSKGRLVHYPRLVGFAQSKSDRARTAPTGRARLSSHPKCPVGPGAISFAPRHGAGGEPRKRPSPTPSPRKRTRAFAAENSPLNCFSPAPRREAAVHPCNFPHYNIHSITHHRIHPMTRLLTPHIATMTELREPHKVIARRYRRPRRAPLSLGGQVVGIGAE